MSECGCNSSHPCIYTCWWLFQISSCTIGDLYPPISCASNSTKGTTTTWSDASDTSGASDKRWCRLSDNVLRPKTPIDMQTLSFTDVVFHYASTSQFQEQISWPLCVHTWTIHVLAIVWSSLFNVDVNYSYTYLVYYSCSLKSIEKIYS